MDRTGKNLILIVPPIRLQPDERAARGDAEPMRQTRAAAARTPDRSSAAAAPRQQRGSAGLRSRVQASRSGE